MAALQDAIGAESEKFAHLQTEFQKDARRRFHRNAQLPLHMPSPTNEDHG
jgi:hypothetical protein